MMMVDHLENITPKAAKQLQKYHEKKYKDSEYYRLDAVLNEDKMMNYLIGGMGVGKTTAILGYLLDVVERGEQFVMLKDFSTQFKKSYVIDFLSNNEVNAFDDVELKDGTHVYATVNGDRVLIGYCVSLANYEDWKGAAYPLVNTFIYDEIDTHRTRKLEYQTFAISRTIQTFSRKRKVKFFATANKVGGYIRSLADLGVDTFNLDYGIHTFPEVSKLLVEIIPPSMQLREAIINSDSGWLFAMLGAVETQIDADNVCDTIYSLVCESDTLEKFKTHVKKAICSIDINDLRKASYLGLRGYLNVYQLGESLWIVDYSSDPCGEIYGGTNSFEILSINRSPLIYDFMERMNNANIRFTTARAVDYFVNTVRLVPLC